MSPSKDPAERPDADDITQLCGLAQTAFYALLGFLAFYAVVILSTTDSDFLIGSKQTEIPLIRWPCRPNGSSSSRHWSGRCSTPTCTSTA